MEYRKLGRTGIEVSAIGLGTEHLTQNVESMEAVLHTAVDAGVNYVDVVWTHAEFWELFQIALKSYRKQLILSIHWGTQPECDLDAYQRTFEDNLTRIDNHYAELAMLTFVDTDFKWNGEVQEALTILSQYKEQGVIGAIGMASHRPLMATKAVKSGLFDVVMTPINIANHHNQEYQALYEACQQHMVGLVAMKVYHGGVLLSSSITRPVTPIHCLHYALSQPISTTVPGVKTATEYQATLQYLNSTEKEKDYTVILPYLEQSLKGQCVYCNHCLPCSQGIDIGRVNRIVDEGQYFPEQERLEEYISLPVKPSACTACGMCLSRCPYEVDIIAKIRKARDLFENDKV